MSRAPDRRGDFILPDGRRLAYREYGLAGGTPVLYFHGWPGAAVEIAHAHADARAAGVRLVAVDRPGMGRSDFLPGRRLVDWPADVEALLDGLGFDRVRILGCSGGGPYAVACAEALGDRLDAVGLICPMGPSWDPDVRRGITFGHRFLLTLATVPLLAEGVFWPAKWLLRGGMDSPLVRWGAGLVRALKGGADAAALADDAVLGPKVEAGQQAFREGPRGVVHDGRILAGPWGFEPEDIRVPVHLWHGELDTKVPPVMSRVLAKRIPGSRATFFEGDGHTSIYVRWMGRILGELVGGE